MWGHLLSLVGHVCAIWTDRKGDGERVRVSVSGSGRMGQ